jgi:hypothetical protein
LTKAQFGAFNPFYDKDTRQLFFNDYQYNGYKIAQTTIDTAFDIAPETDYFSHYYATALTKDSVKNIASVSVDTSQHTKLFLS